MGRSSKSVDCAQELCKKAFEFHTCWNVHHLAPRSTFEFPYWVSTSVLCLTNTFLTDSYTDTVAILSTLWDSQAYMTGCMAHKLCHVFDGAIYTFVNYFRLDKDMQEFSWKSWCVWKFQNYLECLLNLSFVLN